MSLFVDTSVWYAAVDVDDFANSAAKVILNRGEELITTDHVLAETWGLIHHKLNRPAAERFWAGLRGGIASIEAVTLADLESAWQIGQTWRDQDFSIVDRTSFAVMQRLGILRTASLDNHFAVYRFGPNRRHSFTIVR
jgi:predicted nucleic acid-binding protein